MKRLFVLILFFFFYCFEGYTQIFKGVLILGGNLTQVRGDTVIGFYKAGLNVGVGGIIPLSKRFSISIENIFNQKGSYQRPYKVFVDSVNAGEYNLRLNYVDVPVMLHYEDRETMTIGIGISWGRLVSVNEKEFNIKTKHAEWNNVKAGDGTYKTNDFDILADFRFRIYRGLKFNFRYSHSIVPIRKRYFTPKSGTLSQYNTMVSIRFLYVINEPYFQDESKKRKKKE